MLEGPLAGVKVLDLSEDIAGSFCARLLADYGADVLKLEPPGGAALRRMGPFFHDDPHPEKSLFFLVLNLNKKGATLKLDTSVGQTILKRLAQRVDVIVESFRPGYLSSLGLGFADLQELNPSLVMTSITPFGQDGPYSQYRGEEIVSYAMSMIMSISGIQEREPLKHGGFQAQYEGGTLRCRRDGDGIVRAANHRRRGARGRFDNRVRRFYHDGNPDHLPLHGWGAYQTPGPGQHV